MAGGRGGSGSRISPSSSNFPSSPKPRSFGASAISGLVGDLGLCVRGVPRGSQVSLDPLATSGQAKKHAWAWGQRRRTVMILPYLSVAFFRVRHWRTRAGWAVPRGSPFTPSTWIGGGSRRPLSTPIRPAPVVPFAPFASFVRFARFARFSLLARPAPLVADVPGVLFARLVRFVRLVRLVRRLLAPPRTACGPLRSRFRPTRAG